MQWQSCIFHLTELAYILNRKMHVSTAIYCFSSCRKKFHFMAVCLPHTHHVAETSIFVPTYITYGVTYRWYNDMRCHLRFNIGRNKENEQVFCCKEISHTSRTLQRRKVPEQIVPQEWVGREVRVTLEGMVSQMYSRCS